MENPDFSEENEKMFENYRKPGKGGYDNDPLYTSNMMGIHYDSYQSHCRRQEMAMREKMLAVWNQSFPLNQKDGFLCLKK